MPDFQTGQVQLRADHDRENSLTPTGYFVQVPVEVLRDSNLSAPALKLYLLLLAYSGQKKAAWPGQARLAQDMNLSERRVRSIISELEEAGLVEVDRTLGGNNCYYPRHFELRNNRKDSSAPVKIDRSPRKDSSADSHAVESKNMCVSVPAQESGDESIELLVKLLHEAGLSPVNSRELAKFALKNSRDESYVKALVQYSRCETVQNPAGFIRFMILRNADPVPAEKRPARMKTNPKRSGQPLDFAKYTTGKYAFLNRGESTATLSESEPEQPATSLSVDNSTAEYSSRLLAISEPKAPGDAHNTQKELAQTVGSGEQALREWRLLLLEIKNEPFAGCFNPSFGRLDSSGNGKSCYRVVYKSELDLKAARRHLTLLEKAVKRRYGSGIQLTCEVV